MITWGFVWFIKSNPSLLVKRPVYQNYSYILYTVMYNGSQPIGFIYWTFIYLFILILINCISLGLRQLRCLKRKCCFTHRYLRKMLGATVMSSPMCCIFVWHYMCLMLFHERKIFPSISHPYFQVWDVAEIYKITSNRCPQVKYKYFKIYFKVQFVWIPNSSNTDTLGWRATWPKIPKHQYWNWEWHTKIKFLKN